MARSRWKKTLWRLSLLVLVLGIAAGGAYYVYLDRLVSHQFEGRRWTLPAHVYARRWSCMRACSSLRQISGTSWRDCNIGASSGWSAPEPIASRERGWT